MSNNISERDLEYLSAYLDDALNVKDKASIQTRLTREPDLRDALDKFKTTKTVLRAAPKFRVPRNFTLTPEMLQISQPSRVSFNFMRLTSVFASVLFVLVVMGDVVGNSLYAFRQQNDSPMFASEKLVDQFGGLEGDERFAVGELELEIMALEAPVEEDAAIDQMMDGEIEQPEAAPEEINGTLEVEKVFVEEDVEDSEAPVTESETILFEGGGDSLTTPTPTVPVQGTLEPTLEPTPEPSPTLPEPTSTREIIQIIIPTEEPADPSAEPDQDPMRFFRILLLAIEFGLGGVAIGAGVTAYILRKRS